MTNRRLLILVAAAGVAAACSKGDDATPQSAQAAPARPAGSPRGDSVPRPTGPGGGRNAPSITLAASDVATVQRSSIEEGVPLTGDLRPIETVAVRARVEGDLVAVLAREGQRVNQGQMLARFEASEQESAVRSAEADRVAAQTELNTAQWNLEQSQDLFKAGAISERDHKVAQQAVAAARARLAAAEARLRSATIAARDTRVLAPTTGVIERRDVESGEHVSRGATLFTVVRSDVLELAGSVPARQANAVRVGQVVHFVADGRSIDGRVARVSPTIDPSTRTVAVYAQIPNGGGQLKGGTFATGRIVNRTITGALIVPTSAVRQAPDDGHAFVYRIVDRTIDVANVQLGVVDDRRGYAEVLSGLSEGDRVVVGNVGMLGRGMQVQLLGNEGRGGTGVDARGSGAPTRPAGVR